jgi:hypothetical protein
MKKLFILAAAIVAFASCQKEQATYVEDGSIKFTNAQTRATVETTTKSLDVESSFKVLGSAKSDGATEATTIFNNEVTKWNDATTDYWSTETKKFWANNTEYNFFAVFPNSYNYNLTMADDQHSAYFNYTNGGEEDLVLAGTQVKTKDDGTKRGPANLIFNHALSRVKFNFTNGISSANTEVKVDITGLELVDEKQTAVVTINSANEISWGTPTSTCNISYMVASEFTGNKIAEGASMPTAYKYVIPAENKEYKLYGTIKLYDETATIREYVFNESNPLVVKVIDASSKVTKSVLTHEAGKSYTYNMTIHCSFCCKHRLHILRTLNIAICFNSLTVYYRRFFTDSI